MTCHACGKPHPSVTVDRYGAPALCTWCYLKRPFPGVSIGGTISSNDTLSSPSRERPETPAVEPKDVGTPERCVPTSTSTSTAMATSSTAAVRTEETTSVSGATEKTAESRNRKQAGPERFATLERDALTFGPITPARLALEGLSPAQRRVAEDVAYVLGVYAVLDGPDVAQPYSQRWRSSVLGLSHTTVKRALDVLVERGVLTSPGETEPRQGWEHGTKLYAAGRLEPGAVDVELGAVQPAAEDT